MKRRERRSDGRLPDHLAVFDPAVWPGKSDPALPGTDRQWRRLRWNRARTRWLREHREAAR